MSVETFVVNAEPRSDVGKGASRRLRREGRVPAVLFGGNKEPMGLSLEHNEMFQHVGHEAFFSHILTIDVAGKSEKAILKAVQWHTFKPTIVHMDFQRVSESSVIRVHVPLHFVGEESAPGVKAGGIVTHQLNNIEVSCPASKLPEYLEVDVSALNIGEAVHLSDIKLPAGVEIVELSHGPEHDLPVVSIVASRAAVEEEVAVAEEAPAAEGGAEEESAS